jgi:hypothetical protein
MSSEKNVKNPNNWMHKIHLSSEVSLRLLLTPREPEWRRLRASDKGKKRSGRYRCSLARQVYTGLHLLNKISGTSRCFFCRTHALCSEITRSNYISPASLLAVEIWYAWFWRERLLFSAFFPSALLFFRLAFILLILRFARDKLPSAFYARQKARLLVIYQMWEMSDGSSGRRFCSILISAHTKWMVRHGDRFPHHLINYTPNVAAKRPAGNPVAVPVFRLTSTRNL